MAQGDAFALNDHEKVTVRTSTAELLELDAEWQPSRHKPLPHFHPSQDEHFEITEGQVSVKLGSETRELSAGDSVDVPRGVVHTFWNSGTTTARAKWQVRPAQRTEEFFRSIDSLRKQGHGTSAGVSPPAGALLAREYSAEFRPALPQVARTLFLPALAALARRRGYKL